ncbi:serine protease inhibitor Kazal-type 1-like [Drosophila innubila]|uniref:serine protease inhibitor Kazal-type 1-like n=1 Tax=Drosophila innubila TaxID=198719 RepID=UPI00148D9808|nr:serine protease inhibitor Kazal-type 1-like [Drosophila innubila]
MRFLAFFAIFLLALVAFSSADENAANCPCPRNREPVCGSDNQTYSNICLLNCKAKNTGSDLHVVKNGDC